MHQEVERSTMPHIHVSAHEEEYIFKINLLGRTIVQDGDPDDEDRETIGTWIRFRRDELFSNWANALKGEPLTKVEPLK